jgi:hypothetical protein
MCKFVSSLPAPCAVPGYLSLALTVSLFTAPCVPISNFMIVSFTHLYAVHTYMHGCFSLHQHAAGRMETTPLVPIFCVSAPTSRHRRIRVLNAKPCPQALATEQAYHHQ